MLLGHFLCSSHDICACYLFWNFLPGEHTKENWKGQRKTAVVSRVGPRVSLPGGAACGSDLLTLWHPLRHFLGVPSLCQCLLETGSLTGVLPTYRSTERLCTVCPHAALVFLEKLFPLKTAFYSFSLKGFHYQFLNMRSLFMDMRSMLTWSLAPGLCWVSQYRAIHINLPSWSQLNSPWI